MLLSFAYLAFAAVLRVGFVNSVVRGFAGKSWSLRGQIIQCSERPRASFRERRRSHCRRPMPVTGRRPDRDGSGSRVASGVGCSRTAWASTGALDSLGRRPEVRNPVLTDLPVCCRLSLRSHWRLRRDDWRIHFRACPRRAGPDDSPCKSARPSLRTLRLETADTVRFSPDVARHSRAL
jgi:hypothetical protein